MYETFYGLSEKPFLLTPDPAFLYLSKEHSTALTMLEYGITTNAGVTVITGEVGSGKTTLVRRILEMLDPEYAVGLITHTHPKLGDLMKWVLLAYGLEYRDKDPVEAYEVFTDFIIQQYANNRRTLLIIDEAQNLDVETLEELRTLTNVNADKNQVLQLVLVGQPELLESLRRPELRQFAQRISAHAHLKPLAMAETRAYVRHRIAVAGGAGDTFDDFACNIVHHYTGGVPRLINTLCDTALVYGFADDKKQIGADTVRDVVKYKNRSSLNLFRVGAKG